MNRDRAWVEPRDFPHFIPRLRVLVALGALLLIIFLARLVQMQLVRGERYAVEAESYLWRHPRIDAPRGLIVDRRGTLLASNRVVHDVIYTRGEMSRAESRSAIEALIRHFPETATRWLAILDEGRRLSRRPHTLAEGLTLAEVTPLLEELDALEGVEVHERFDRLYPVQGLELGHVLGYVRQVNPEIFRRLLNRQGVETDEFDWDAMSNLTTFANLLLRHGYALNDRVGVQGIELMREENLRGSKGRERHLQNVEGLVLEASVAESAQPGLTVQLTLDMEMQRRAVELMAGEPGALVAMDAHSGAILALVSSPGFDSDQPMTGRGWGVAVTDPRRRLFNRATRDVYNPGSTFKPLVALGALRDGAIERDTRFYCDGTHRMGNFTFRCDYQWGCEWMDLRNALRRSCNIFFYNTATRMGQDGWERVVREFGLFQPTGIDLPGESRGHPPARQVYPGEIVQMGIGQGPFDSTPLQMVTAYAKLGSNNAAVTPHVVERLLTEEGRIEWQWAPPAPVTPVIASMEERDRQEVLEGLRLVCRTGVSYEERGTATRVGFPPEWDTGGKTGTAQNRGLIDSWFIGMAPVSSPEIVVGCVMEGAGHGGDVAAPIVRDMMGVWFGEDQSSEEEVPAE
jgi:penicillin-binding protein 2